MVRARDRDSMRPKRGVGRSSNDGKDVDFDW